MFKIVRLLCALMMLQGWFLLAMEPSALLFEELPSEIRWNVVTKVIEDTKSLNESVEALKKLGLVNKAMRSFISGADMVKFLAKKWRVSTLVVLHKMRALISSETVAQIVDDFRMKIINKIVWEVPEATGLHIDDYIYDEPSQAIFVVASVTLTALAEEEESESRTMIVLFKLFADGTLDTEFGKEQDYALGLINTRASKIKEGILMFEEFPRGPIRIRYSHAQSRVTITFTRGILGEGTQQAEYMFTGKGRFTGVSFNGAKPLHLPLPEKSKFWNY